MQSANLTPALTGAYTDAVYAIDEKNATRAHDNKRISRLERTTAQPITRKCQTRVTTRNE